jgi:cytochrome c oxidase subunit II
MHRFSVALLAAAVAAYWPASALAGEQVPQQSTVQPHAAPAELIAGLTWWMIAVFGLVFVVVMLLVGIGILRGLGKGKSLTSRASRNLVVLGGVVVPLLVLLGFTVGSLLVGQASSRAYPEAELTVEVTGKRWWWEIRYYDRDERLLAITANELHLPAGEPVKLLLRASDVIHSFWVPNLDGKTDMIPGMTNVA